MRARTLQIHGKKTEYLISVSVTCVHLNGKHNYISTLWHTHTQNTAEFPCGRVAQNLNSKDGGDYSSLAECSTVVQFQRKARAVDLAKNGQVPLKASLPGRKTSRAPHYFIGANIKLGTQASLKTEKAMGQ